MGLTWMIYGANGYTGRLISDLAVSRNERPVLAGRNSKETAEMAGRLGLEHRVVGLDDPAALRAALSGIDAVVHCAGPFSHTARQMVDACLETRTNYLDISGELDVFEEIYGRHQEAMAAEVSLIPGAGCDVVPSDCLVAMLHGMLPSADWVTVAYQIRGRSSPGTRKTVMEALTREQRARFDAKLVDRIPKELSDRYFPFLTGRGPGRAATLAELSSIHRTTGISNVVTYATPFVSMKVATFIANIAGPALALNRPTQKVIQSVVGLTGGPSKRSRAASKSELWAELRDPEGRSVSGSILGISGYDLTADSITRIAIKSAEGKIDPGSLTPSQAMGPDFVTELDDIELHIPH
jgi:saccharopine dehydrogenase (NAD+, L-lysine-forming)